MLRVLTLRASVAVLTIVCAGVIATAQAPPLTDARSFEGRPAPPLESPEYLGPPFVGLESLRGKVVLLFFWAHWCPDCKAEGPIIARLLDRYRSRGLTIVAPTQRYGFAAEGQPATPAAELRHITEVRNTHYRFLRDVPVPLSTANFKQYDVGATPTLVLVDRQGTVFRYHPGRMPEQDLETAIRNLLR